ncbi:MAG: S9 family peptidase [Nitrosomonas sp.]|nr:MAG: S9 family peptidase [Nitrosomonas sp.]
MGETSMWLRHYRQLLAQILFLASCSFTSSPAIYVDFVYPLTPKDVVIDRLHDTDVLDSYRWLEDGEDPKVVEWTENQNRLTNVFVADRVNYSFLAKRLEELLRCKRISFQDVPVGNRRFVWLQQPNEDQRVLYWQEDGDAPMVELLNPNQWSDGKTLDYAVPSPDGVYVACGVSLAGNECPELQIIEVATGEVLPDTLRGRRHGWFHAAVSWLSDNSGFFYTASPEADEVSESEADYWSAVYFHRLGTNKDEDKVIFSHPTIREYVHMADVSDDGQWIIFDRSLGNNNEVYLQNLQDPNAPFIPLATDFDASYCANFVGSKIVIVTDLNAPNRKAYLVDPNHPERSNWRLLLPEKPDPLLNIRGVGGLFYAEYLHNAHTVVNIYSPDGLFLHSLRLQSMGTATVSGLWHKPNVWVDFSSFAHPRCRYSYDVNNDTLTPWGISDFAVDSTRYTVEQRWYPSKDGTRISMFLVYDRTASSTQYRPTLLTGYGGFGIPVTPDFNSFYIPFLEAGGLLAIPNLRGGGEYGELWHHAGMLDKKQNVFDDFIAAAEWLVKSGYTTPDMLAIRGRSNGGLLVGAAMTQRPDLFRAVLCEVPLLDMVRYHKFGFSNIWAGEYGNADNSEQFRYLLRYSPYHQVVDGVSYPAILMSGAENDSRTDVLHAKKMIARLQEADPEGYLKLLLVDKNAGHLGAATIAGQVEQKAIALTFLMDQLGINGGFNDSDSR